ncbi:MAG: GNAT family N-acetyltransferase [Thermoflexales bacterium]|nr:GNAT family N-acetyltransferase [Thermoflexales bacterium]
MPTLGAQVVPARFGELRRALAQLTAEEVGALDPALGDWLRRPLGREALTTYLIAAAGSTFVCLMSLEPAGVMVLERGEKAARVRLLAVAPDMRRRGLARTLLEHADGVTRRAGLRWLWMLVPAANLSATRCALSCGYRRYRPQYMRRAHPASLPSALAPVSLDPVPLDQASSELTLWISRAARQGDAWCADLATHDVRPWSFAAPSTGIIYHIRAAQQTVGLAAVQRETEAHVALWLWLDRAHWGSEVEMSALKALLGSLDFEPHTLDVELGSTEHLRYAAPLYKAAGFVPLLRERVVMIKRLPRAG